MTFIVYLEVTLTIYHCSAAIGQVLDKEATQKQLLQSKQSNIGIPCNHMAPKGGNVQCSQVSELFIESGAPHAHILVGEFPMRLIGYLLL